tara:strand:- start:368269 stop:368778 length:510 start_codon:yes stop_codon:yes gene_type:complete
MKNTTINLRIDPFTKDQLEVLSEKKNVTVSSVIREAVNQFLDNEITLEPELVKTKEGLHIVRSIGFSEFVFWLYHKAFDPFESEIKELYQQFIDLIDECKKYPIFNPELIVEFEKVSRELKKVLYDDSYNKAYFEFSGRTENSFDYQVLANFMQTIRYDSDNNKVIHIK